MAGTHEAGRSETPRHGADRAVQQAYEDALKAFQHRSYGSLHHELMELHAYADVLRRAREELAGPS
jgi:hypothetical protein